MAIGTQQDPFLFKQNDNRPKIRLYAKQGAVGSQVAIDLTTASSAVFNMRLAGSPGTVVIDRGSATILSPASAGGLEFTVAAADTADTGDYLGEFEVTFADGGILTIPNGEDWLYITIGDDIA